MFVKKYDLDILNQMAADSLMKQKEISEKCGYSVGLVNASLRNLKQSGYLDPQTGALTNKAKTLFDHSRPSRAIILAAGYGMRMVPINTQTPKGLLQVKGQTLIERLIRQLHEVGIKDIAVVVGFMKEAYEYLIDEYGVSLLVNSEYSSKNNLFSLLCAKEWLSDCYVMPCDIWGAENPFRERELYSWYMVSEKSNAESNVRVSRALDLVPIKRGEKGNRMIGIAYFTAEDAAKLCASMEALAGSGECDNSFWEEALFRKEMDPVAARLVDDSSVCEINTYEELKELDRDSVHLHSDALCAAAAALGAASDDICDISVLKKGMTNRSFLFSCRGKRYIMRIPGEGTDQLIDRAQEAEVYRAIAGKGLCDDPVYIDPATGYKITAFLENVRSCDATCREDLKRCMKKLREFHEMHLQVGHAFDIFGQIEFYESLWRGTKSIYRDYGQTKKKVLSLKKYIDAHTGERVLTHIDAVPDNFLFYFDGQGESLQLTDWEYAGMQDPHVDIAMFCIYAMYDRKQTDELIDLYFDGECPQETRLKIYCYVAACGLLWSNWCEYKRNLGVEFGEYSLRQYRYAKEYYRLFVKEYEKMRACDPSAQEASFKEEAYEL